MKIGKVVSLSLLVCFLAAALPAQTTAPAVPAKKASDKGTAYYHYALGHLYAELASAYGTRGDYLNKAIDNYRLAIKADPEANFLSEELSDLYIQAGRLRDAVLEAEETIRQNPSDVNARRVLGRIYTRMIGDAQQGKVNEDMLRKAIEQYTKVTQLKPEDLETWLMLGRLNKIAQNSVEAEKAFQKAMELDPESEDALLGLALVYSDLGDNKRAADLLNRLTQKNPSVRTLMQLATSYEQMRDYSLAAETLRKTLTLSPGNVEVKKALAQNLLMAENFAEALAVYNQLAVDDPRDAMTHLRISQIYRQQKDFVKARDAARKAREVEPNNLEVRYNEVNLLEAEGKTAEAIVALRELLDTGAKRTYSTGEKGNRVLLLEKLGLLYRSNHQYPEAVGAFRQIGELDPALAGRAAAQAIDTFRSAKDFKKALEEADAAIARHAEDRTVRAVRASLLADLGRTDEAAAEVKKLLDGKNDRETYITLAQIYEKGKNYAEMAKAVDAAEKLSQNTDEKESIAFMRGAMFEKQKKHDAAEAEFRKVIALNPKNASALNYLGYMLADRNVRLQEAHDLVTQALAIEPNNGAYLDSLGWVLYRLGKLEDAETQLKLALAQFSTDPTIHDHLGDVYFRLGRVKEAIDQWQISLKQWETSAPSETDAAEVAKVAKKLESARVRLAKESGASGNRQQP